MRIQLELPDAKVVRLKRMMELTEIDNYKELFNNALTLLDWAIEQSIADKSIASVDEGTDRYRVLLMPALETAARSAESQRQDQQTVSTEATAAQVR